MGHLDDYLTDLLDCSNCNGEAFSPTGATPLTEPFFLEESDLTQEDLLKFFTSTTAEPTLNSTRRRRCKDAKKEFRVLQAWQVADATLLRCNESFHSATNQRLEGRSRWKPSTSQFTDPTWLPEGGDS